MASKNANWEEPSNRLPPSLADLGSGSQQTSLTHLAKTVSWGSRAFRGRTPPSFLGAGRESGGGELRLHISSRLSFVPNRDFGREGVVILDIQAGRVLTANSAYAFCHLRVLGEITMPETGTRNPDSSEGGAEPLVAGGRFRLRILSSPSFSVNPVERGHVSSHPQLRTV